GRRGARILVGPGQKAQRFPLRRVEPVNELQLPREPRQAVEEPGNSLSQRSFLAVGRARGQGRDRHHSFCVDSKLILATTLRQRILLDRSDTIPMASPAPTLSSPT